MFNGCDYLRYDTGMRYLYLTVCDFTGEHLVTGHRTSETRNDTKMGTGSWQGVLGGGVQDFYNLEWFGSICKEFPVVLLHTNWWKGEEKIIISEREIKMSTRYH